MTQWEQCQTLKDHQQENDGQTDLVWLEDHTKNCSLCQQTIQRIRELLDNAIEESGVNK